MAGGLTLVLLLLWLFGGSSATNIIPPGTPPVVIVTTLDPQMSQTFRNNIKENRRDYAAKHGYATFFPNTTDYDVMAGVPKSWSTVPAMRHAMTVYPALAVPGVVSVGVGVDHGHERGSVHQGAGSAEAGEYDNCGQAPSCRPTA